MKQRINKKNSFVLVISEGAGKIYSFNLSLIFERSLTARNPWYRIIFKEWGRSVLQNRTNFRQH